MKYKNPVAKLLKYGNCKDFHAWPDYICEINLKSEHIPELIRMATDETLNRADSDSSKVWAPLHAWRALGLLQAEEAIEPLMALFHVLKNDDWSAEELPIVYQMIGTKSIPELGRYLKDSSHETFSRVIAAHSLERIGNTYPESKEKCQNILEEQLKCFEDNDPELNALLISFLVDLQTLPALPTMKKAFDSGNVDLRVGGDFEDIEIDLGVRKSRSKP
nr:hypothetical protein [uncultured Desulfobacter sp.]